jgi:hypothetical protein
MTCSACRGINILSNTLIGIRIPIRACWVSLYQHRWCLDSSVRCFCLFLGRADTSFLSPFFSTADKSTNIVISADTGFCRQRFTPADRRTDFSQPRWWQLFEWRWYIFYVLSIRAFFVQVSASFLRLCAAFPVGMLVVSDIHYNRHC